MNEYLSKEVIARYLKAYSEKESNSNSPYGMITSSVLAKAQRALIEFPAADVQPVVHCKDCKHRKEHHYEESGEKPYIKYECKFTGYSMSDDGFCSFGARMDGDNEGKATETVLNLVSQPCTLCGNNCQVSFLEQFKVRNELCKEREQKVKDGDTEVRV